MMTDLLEPKYYFVWELFGANPWSVKFQNLLIGFVDVTNLIIHDAVFHIFERFK